MLANDLLSDTLFPLKSSDTCVKALEIMNEYGVSDLPVVSEMACIGYVNSLDLVDADKKKESVTRHLSRKPITQVGLNQHYFEIIRTLGETQLTTLSVADEQNRFAGIISGKELFQKIKGASIFYEQGGIITISSTLRDYSFSEISRIIEYNNAKILGMIVHTQPDSQQIDIVIKLNTTDLKNIIATFERYNYSITASYLRTDDTESLRDRYDSLMKYLDM